MAEFVIGVDLGGTKILYGIGTLDGNILFKNTIPTNAYKGSDYVINKITDICNSLIINYQNKGEILGIAIATPGPLAYPDGIVLNSPNLKWNKINLLEEMQNRFKGRIIVEKDTNIAALGVYYFEQNKRYQNLIYVTVSTGIGGGIIINGSLYRGFKGGAGEVGHMVVDSDGEQCQCGRKGCLEALVSGTALAKQGQVLVGRGFNKIGAKEIGELARQGDDIALNIIHRAADNLSIGIANLVNIFNPQAVFLGGGVMQGLKDLWLERIKTQVYNQAFPLNAQNLEIEVTKLREDIGLYGCIAAFVDRIDNNK